MVNFLQGHFNQDYVGYSHAQRDVQHFFYDVKPKDVNCVDQFNVHTIVITHNLHQVCNVGFEKISLQVQNLFCFCRFCTNGGDGPCDHVDYVPRFNLIQLVACRLEDVWNEIDDNCLIGDDREILLAASLNVGEHFIIIAAKDNEEANDFWIFICEMFLAMVDEVSKIDHWGEEVYMGKQIVVGKYYKVCSLMSYILCDGRPVFIYSHLVIVAKFNMVVVWHRQRGGSQVYTLPT